MSRDVLSLPPYVVRRKDRAVDDDAWIVAMLRTAPYGVLATSHEGQPFVNSNLFVYDEDEHAIFMHTARTGRTSSNVGLEERVAFTVFEMGRLLPAPRAFNMSVEYDGVVVFGKARLLDGDDEKQFALQKLIDKYFVHLQAEEDYALPSAEELSLTAAYRIAIDSWSGKRKAVESDFPGAFRYPRSAGQEKIDEFPTGI